MASKKQKKKKIVRPTRNKIDQVNQVGTTLRDCRVELIMLVLMCIFVFLLYAHTLKYPFHFDDEVTIIENANLKVTSVTWEQIKGIYKNFSGFRPTSLATFALNYYLGQHETFGYHLFNILIHIINGLMIYLFVQKTIRLNEVHKPVNNCKLTTDNHLLFVPFFTALIWMVHPLQTNSVTYIVQRMNSLACLFYMTAMVLYIQGRLIHTGILINGADVRRPVNQKQKAFFYYSASLIASLLAFGSKEISITLPFFILLYETYFFQNLDRKFIKRSSVIIVLLVIMTAIAIEVLIGSDIIYWYFNVYYEGYSFTPLQRVLTEFRVVIYYLGLFFFPHPNRLNFDHDFPLSYSLLDPATTLLSLGAIIIMLTASVFFARKEKILSFGILWYFGNLAIESSVIPLDIIFEHRVYLPSIMVSMIITCFIWRNIKPVPVKIALLSFLTVVLSFWTFHRNLVWETPISLWEDCVKKSPNKARPHADLGRSLEMAGRLDEAIDEYRKTLKINPFHQFTLRNLGLALYKKGDLDQAIFYYRKALESDPTLGEAHNDLGVALIDKKQIEEGIYHYKKALKFKPNHPEAPANLKKAIIGLKQINDHITTAEAQAKMDPSNPKYYQHLGFLFYQKGKFQTGIDYYKQALSLNPTDIQSLKGLAEIYIQIKKYESAISLLQKILVLQPDDSSTYYNMACIFSLQNKKKEAIFWLDRAFKAGFIKRETLMNDRDLKNLRQTKEFKKLIDRLQ